MEFLSHPNLPTVGYCWIAMPPRAIPRVIAAHQRPGTLQVFIRHWGVIWMFISDERGSLIAHSIESESADSYLAALAHFIQAVLDRNRCMMFWRKTMRG